MFWLLILSVFMSFKLGGWWWLVTIIFGILWLAEPTPSPTKQPKSEPSEQELKIQEYLRTLYESTMKYRERNPNWVTEFSEKYINEVKKRVLNSKEFCPVTNNPSAEIDVICPLHQQGDIEVVLAVAPKKGEPKALWVVDVFLDELKS